MKKSLILVLVLALLLPLAAKAAPPVVYPAETVLSVSTLTKEQQVLVEYLYQPIMNGEQRIELPENTQYDDVGAAMSALARDYPEMFHLGRQWTTSYYQSDPSVAVAVTPQYRMGAAEAEALRQQMYSVALTMIRQNPTAQGLHDALVERVTYGGTTELRYTAVGALLEGRAVCEGYAQALSLLYRMAGIPCGVISGVGYSSDSPVPENHAWNLAWLNGATLIDPTWNDQESAGHNTCWYYGLSTEQMAVDHVPDSDQSIPPCGDQDNWHVQRGLVIDSYEEALAAIIPLARNDETVNIRFSSAALYAQIARNPGAFMDDYNAWCAQGNEFYGGYSYMNSDEQLCIIFSRPD